MERIFFKNIREAVSAIRNDPVARGKSEQAVTSMENRSRHPFFTHIREAVNVLRGPNSNRSKIK